MDKNLNSRQVFELSKELYQLDKSIESLTEIAKSTDVTADQVTYLCVKQDRVTQPAPLGMEAMPPFMLPIQVAANPEQAAIFLRNVMQADRNRLEAGEVAPIQEPIRHVDLQLSQRDLYLVMDVVIKQKNNRRTEIAGQLCNLLKLPHGL